MTSCRYIFNMPPPNLPDLRALFDASNHFMGLLSLDGSLLDANATSLKAAGTTLEEVQGRPFWETPWWTHDPQQQARLRAGIEQAARGDEFRMETTHTTAEGRLLVVMFSIRPLRDAAGRLVGLMPEGRDITDLAEERERLRLSEARFRLLVEHAPDAIVMLNATTGRFVEVNAGAEVLFKTGRRNLLGSGPLDFSPSHQPDGQPSAKQAWAQIKKALDEGTVTFEWTHLTSDGEEVPCEVQLLRLLGSGDVLLRGSLVDLRPRLARERNLLESERKFRLLFEQSVEGLLLLDGDRFTDFNPAVLEMLRCTEPEFVRLHPWELSPPTQPDGRGSQEKALEMMRTAHAAGVHRFEWVHRRMTGEDFPVEVTLIPIPLGGREVLFTSWRDITDRKQAEEDRLSLQRQMLDAQKLESLGVLAGGIAHDFNNLLTAILTNINLAEELLPVQAPVQAQLAAAGRATLKAAELTRQMLAYSGKGRFVVKAHDFNAVVLELTDLVKASIGKRIALRYSLEEHLPHVEADAAQIQQVILNLVTNASDAIGEGDGEIRIATVSRSLDEAGLAAELPGQGLPPGRHVLLEVTDTGCGMAPEVLARIFDPFFTTKSKGHGLGLAALLGIVNGHHAGLQVHSEPGVGTTFRLYFPVIQYVPEPPVEVPAEPHVRLEGRILLVDDEEAILVVGRQALERLGFEVETAADGIEAVTLFSRRPHAYRMALVDLTMPRMSGRDCFLALRALRPDLPVVLSSGFSEQESVKQFLGEGLAGFIQKPYTLPQLRRVLSAALRS